MTPRLLWSPSQETIEHSNLHQYINWLNVERGMKFEGYQDLWVWSTENVAEFWESIWSYFEIIHDGKFDTPLSGTAMPEYQWFKGTRLNYAEHIFRRYSDAQPALIFQSETEPARPISWQELKNKVFALQQFLLQVGVHEGDCVAAYLPCVPEATIAFLAANSLGAIWSSCSPDFGAQSVIDRFGQTRPKVLIACVDYFYGGKVHDKSDVIQKIINQLPDLQSVILLGGGNINGSTPCTSWTDATRDDNPGHELTFNRVPFSHPMWVLYSSGTTGLPKAITHSHGGILLEHFKYLTFHNNVKPGERFFWYSTTGWMMWNFMQSSLLCGATLVVYDGSPAYPSLDVLWKLVQETKINHFGTSAAFILTNIKENRRPKDFNVSSLRSIGSTGSTLPSEGFDWIYNQVKTDLWLASMSGGTDVCSAFVGGNPLWPVYSGEIQCRALGCRMEAFDEHGKTLLNEVGEMVITAPMPSMPIYFWNDPGFARYKESYFEMFPSLWRHGDWIEITSRSGVIIYGRSDATLNRGGVRIGTSEIYRAVDKVKEVRDSIMVCVETGKGDFYMPLFVQMKEGFGLTEETVKKINQTIRQEYSPRHVPDEVVAIPDVPYTISGKKTETPVKKILMGKSLADVASAGSLRNPEALTFFVEFYKSKALLKK